MKLTKLDDRICGRILEMRIALNIAPRDFAASIDYDIKTVQRMDNDHDISKGVLAAIIDAYNIDIDWLTDSSPNAFNYFLKQIRTGKKTVNFIKTRFNDGNSQYNISKTEFR